MPLDTYANLQASILSWLARPGDPLVSPSIPDIIELFEREATRRLKVGGAEKRVSLTALSAAVALPADFGELRLATSGGVVLTYVTPMQLPDGGGPPAHYTIIGNEMRLGPSPSGGCTVEIVYQSGVPPLSDTNTTNWLLTAHPDCYLFGSLVEAESFIGSDERVPLWAQRREAAFASIESADRKARWGGAPLSIRAEGVSGGNGTAAGDWTSAPPVPIPIAAIVAGDGLTGGGTEGIVTVALSTPVAVSRGGTGAATAAAALANLGGAPLASPALSGNPTAPTPAPGDADTSIATTAFVGAALSAQALAGDVTGPTNTTAVVRLQGRPVAATAPTSLQVLQWSGTNWVPATIAAGGTLTGITAGTGIAVSGAAPSPTVALTVPVTVANGGTGATTAAAALTALGAVAKAGDSMTGDLAVTGGIALHGSTSGFFFEDRVTSSDNWMWYATGGTARLFNGVAGADRVTVNHGGGVVAVGGISAGDVMLSSGANAGYIFNDRTTAAQWLLSANAGVAALFSGANRLTVDLSGNMVAGGTITAGGNANATLTTAAGNYTVIYAPDGTANNRSIMIGSAAVSGYTMYKNTIHYFADPTGGANFAYFDSAGTHNVSGAWIVISDPSVKEQVSPYTRGLDAVLALEPVQFRYVAGTPFATEDAPSRLLFGLMADQVRPHVPEIVGQTIATVRGADTTLDTLEPGLLVFALVNAVKELTARLSALEGKPA